MKKVRYAVVGAGWISQEAFMPAIAQTGNSEITAIVSGSADVARKLADFHGVPHIFTYDQYDKMLAADLVDAVYIALPNSMHADYAIRAAKAGKHALVEKPLAVDEAESRAMMAAAEENGTYLMTAYRLHNEPGTLDVLARIKAGEIGDPRIFSSIFSVRLDGSNHRLLARHWGGPLQDIGVYCLNAMRHVFGAEPTEVTAVASHGDNNPLFDEVPESISATLRFPGGRIGQFIVSFGADGADSYTVSGTEGTMTLSPAFKFQGATGLEITKGDETRRIDYPRTDHFAGQAAYLSDCILSGQPPRLTGSEGLADVVIMRAIEHATETGQAQRIAGLSPIVQPQPDMERQLPVTDHRLVL